MDDPFDPLDDLVSAYLDDEVTPAERAQVEADPALIARVDRLREVRRRLNDVEIDDGEREGTIAAALAAFDALDDDAAPAAPTAPAPAVRHDELGRRRAQRRSLGLNRAIGWIGAAAAVGLAVFALGRNLGSDDMDSSSSASDTTTAAAAAEVAATKDAAADIAAAAPATLGEIAGGAVQASEADASADTMAASETTAAAQATTFAAPAFSTDDEVRAYVTALVESGPPVPLASTPDPRFCTLPGGTEGVLLGPVTWQGSAGELLLSPDVIAPVKAVVLSGDCKTVLTSVELTG